VEIFGTQYAMRIWLNPDKLTEYQMTVQDVITALKDYNVEVSAAVRRSAGRERPAPERKHYCPEPSQTPEEFAEIPLRLNPDGSFVLVKDVASAELGPNCTTGGIISTANHCHAGHPAGGWRQRPEYGDNIRAKMKEMSEFFPRGPEDRLPMDTTPFVKVAIHRGRQDPFRGDRAGFPGDVPVPRKHEATLIPTIAVPVVILGTFAVLGLFGFSINMLTMFAMVLAIGLLVDDAIVSWRTSSAS